MMREKGGAPIGSGTVQREQRPAWGCYGQYRRGYFPRKSPWGSGLWRNCGPSPRHIPVKNASKLRKEPLIDAVASALLERERMREVLLALEPEEWGLFRRAAETGICHPKKADDGCGLALQRLGYLYRFQDADKEAYAVPEEVRAAYHGACRRRFSRAERAGGIGSTPTPWRRVNLVRRDSTGGI